ncbi:MAG TPA: ankyrin repeat domain-containing protein [Candidatus Krumholzibacteria bacterium]|nr:ankyrin repeat domain-containing protein [Candidatus Krumholzibacteria bacterium]
MATADEALQAVIEGDADALHAALTADPEAADAIDAQGIPILMQAIYKRRRDLVDILLAAEPTLDVFEAAALGEQAWLEDLLDIDPGAAAAHAADGFTALHLAAVFGHESCMHVLLAHGADVHAVARDGRDAVQLAEQAGHTQLAAQLLSAKNPPAAARAGAGFAPKRSA